MWDDPTEDAGEAGETGDLIVGSEEMGSESDLDLDLDLTLLLFDSSILLRGGSDEP